MSVVRGRPPGLAGGIRGASTAYCSSLSACPAPKSPTKTRLSAVHIACLQEGLLLSLNRRPGHYASSSLSTARAFQTASKQARGARARDRFADRKISFGEMPDPADRWQARVRGWCSRGFWLAEWGAKPGEMGCM